MIHIHLLSLLQSWEGVGEAEDLIKLKPVAFPASCYMSVGGTFCGDHASDHPEARFMPWSVTASPATMARASQLRMTTRSRRPWRSRKRCRGRDHAGRL